MALMGKLVLPMAEAPRRSARESAGRRFTNPRHPISLAQGLVARWLPRHCARLAFRSIKHGQTQAPTASRGRPPGGETLVDASAAPIPPESAPLAAARVRHRPGKHAVM